MVETALALSGSAAQSKVQAYPGDADFFERINIITPTREEACRVLADLMRDKAASSAGGPNHRFMDMRFGSYPYDVVRDGETQKQGGSIVWKLAEIEAGAIEVTRPDGSPASLTLDEMAHDPGWCKIDWIVGDPANKRLANASNMFDVTWEAPDGSITPLDGQLDAYFQEVYLDAASIPIFSKLAKHVSEDALGDYCDALEKEVHHYLGDPNYGKAARRMYNLFRMNGRYAEAAYIRELFDEPASSCTRCGRSSGPSRRRRPRLADGRRDGAGPGRPARRSASSTPSTAARRPRSSRRCWPCATACRTTPTVASWPRRSRAPAPGSSTS